MFFILSKTLGTLSVPSHLITLLGVGGLALLGTGFARAGRWLLAASLALLVILGLLPAGTILTLVLEQRFPPWVASGNPPDGIIVLGGAIDPERSAARGMVSLNETAERVTEIAALGRRFPQARIVFTGGSANLVFAGPPESAFMLDLLESFGIPRSRVELEERSRNTLENARFTKALVDPKPGSRWLLITSAMHMPRAIGVFRQIGFPVEAYPVDWHTEGWIEVVKGPFWPVGGLLRTDLASKEWAGLFAYWLAGYTPELLPGPTAPHQAAYRPAVAIP
jgi:uncharacterized SAM-binding protein YcdF (DUF218 family)